MNSHATGSNRHRTIFSDRLNSPWRNNDPVGRCSVSKFFADFPFGVSHGVLSRLGIFVDRLLFFFFFGRTEYDFVGSGGSK